MEFNGQYLTYEEYRLLGGTLDLMPFNLLEFEARKKIDGRTQNRLQNTEVDNIPQAVKLCEYQMIKTINNYAKSLTSVSQSGNIASESIDGYSVTYATNTQAETVIEGKETELKEIIEDYLMGVVYNGEHLLYLGVKEV